ncbi:MAG: PIG-L family deacetylase [Verrucomicrobia bacterium]|nr:PIG-L family deacetylase [Verrucomicrobiota bacterium]
MLKTDLMGVFAHPDDETGVAATLAHYALGEKKIVANVYCTRGEGGGNMVGTQGGVALGILREAELRACLQRLGVKYCYFLDRRDFAYTESLLATLDRWNKEETLRDLVRLVRSLRPEVIVTMDPAPTPGQHGNHQAAGLLATEAFTAAADPRRFPEQLGAEGLHPWQTRKLYYSGWDDQLQTSIPVTNALPDGGFPWQAAGEALANHRSQAFGNFAASPRMRRAQLFRLVKSVVPGANEADLFRGLPFPSNSPMAVQRLGVESGGPLRIEFRSRPAISNYNRWTREQGIENVAKKMPADIPVTAGEPNEARVSVANAAGDSFRGEMRFVTPPGWEISPSQWSFAVAGGQTAARALRVTPPAGFQGAATIEAISTGGSRETRQKLNVNAVPALRATRLSRAPAMDGSEAGWEIAPFHSIPHTNRWQGEARDAADVSGRFRVGVYQRALFLDVRVTDDVVVTNIAPDDIKGHWRSDSIEICLDPQAGAENALGSYKLGVFPFDTTGVVKGARDADANPGPIAESAPKTRLASFRTPDGYRILAAIPFSEIGVARAKRIGFNVLIYDGDKAGAQLGENINKTRLAWAPRSGVQGRPEDWGRLDLE